MKVVGFSLWQRAGWKGGGRGGKLKRGAKGFKSGNAANQKSVGMNSRGGRSQGKEKQGVQKSKER